jgi:undecaprenyl-phosphate 4-deoxy-4-formamido-L-arabinose transferase
MTTTAGVAVVVPVYGNADTLTELFRRLDGALGGKLVEVVFVDDGSPDASRQVILELARDDPRVHPVLLEHNRGQHTATLAGLRTVTTEWTVVMDADLQDPPEAVPLLLERAARGDVAAVFGGRRGRYEPLGRRITSIAYKRLLARIAHVPHDAGTFVVLSRPLVSRLLTMGGPSPSLVAMIGCAGLPVASVPIERVPRPRGKSAYTRFKRLRSGACAVRWVVWWRLRGAQR